MNNERLNVTSREYPHDIVRYVILGIILIAGILSGYNIYLGNLTAAKFTTLVLLVALILEYVYEQYFA